MVVNIDCLADRLLKSHMFHLVRRLQDVRMVARVTLGGRVSCTVSTVGSVGGCFLRGADEDKEGPVGMRN